MLLGHLVVANITTFLGYSTIRLRATVNVRAVVKALLCACPYQQSGPHGLQHAIHPPIPYPHALYECSANFVKRSFPVRIGASLMYHVLAP